MKKSLVKTQKQCYQIDAATLNFDELEDPTSFFKKIFYRKKNSYFLFIESLCNTQDLHLLKDKIDYLLSDKVSFLKNYQYQIVTALTDNFIYYNEHISDSYVSTEMYDFLKSKGFFHDLTKLYDTTDNTILKELLQQKTCCLLFNVVFRNKLELYEKCIETFGLRRCLAAKFSDDEFVCSYSSFEMFKHLFQTLNVGSVFTFDELDKLLHHETKKFDSSYNSCERMKILLKYGASFEYSIDRSTSLSQMFDRDSLKKSLYNELERHELLPYVVSERLRNDYDLPPDQIFQFMNCDKVVRLLNVVPDLADVQSLTQLVQSELSKSKCKLNI